MSDKKEINYPNIASEFVALTHYCRWIPELNRRENWKEVTDRVINYFKDKNWLDNVPVKVFNKIKSAGNELNLPGILIDNACLLYKLITDSMKVKKGPVRRGLMAYCQSVVCKSKNNFVKPENFLKPYGITMAKFNEGAKLFRRLIHHKTNERSSVKKSCSELTDLKE